MARGLRIGGGGDYYVDFTALGSNENPISRGGVWTNASSGTGGNAALAPNQSMLIGLADDGVTRICYESTATDDYDDSVSFVPGFAGNQRVVATLYKKSGYVPSGGTNHEVEIHLGCVSFGTANKRCVEIGFNYAGGWFVAGFDGDLTSWDTVMTSPWSAGATGSGSTPVDGDVYTAELDRTAKTVKCWQNSTLVISLQWNDTAMVSSTAQTVLNNLGNGAGLGALRRILGGGGIAGALGWRNFRISSTITGAP